MIAAIDLKTEYLQNPIGIDIRNPRLMWKVMDAKKQTAFQLKYILNDGQEKEWDRIETDEMQGCLDLNLASRDRVKWSVRLWNENGEAGDWSQYQSFEMGLLNQENDWKACWIMGDYHHDSKADIRYPADCFREKFTLAGHEENGVCSEKKIDRARLYITACGIYEARINGRKVTRRVLTPGSTAFQKRVHYQTYDVTDMLTDNNGVEGCEIKDNCGKDNKLKDISLEVTLADGFYASKTGCFDKAKVFGYEPRVIYQLEIYYKDGSSDIISSGGNTDWSNDGPVRYGDLKDGEDIDFRMSPTYTDKARLTDYQGIICCDNNVEVMEHERLENPDIIRTPDGNIVLDFRQNISGYVEVTLKGKAGQETAIICGEKLDENGNFTQQNISLKGDYDKNRFQTVKYILSGEKETYHPAFTVMGFQYVLLKDWPEEVRPENFTAIAVYSAMPVTYEFECSNQGINQIVENTLWSVKGNFLDLPTDCPTRERAGWTGDAQLFFNTGNYLMDQTALFRKWFWDIEDVQKDNGMVYNINPSNPTGNNLLEWLSVEGGVGWGDAFLMIPYFYWKRYSDDSLMQDHWEAMKRCFAFYEKRIGKKNIFTAFKHYRGAHGKYVAACGRDFGEWTEPDDCAPGKMSLMLPHPEESTAYIAFDAGIMAEMAEHLGKKTESARYREIHENMKAAYRENFLPQGLESKRMAKYVRPVGLGLVEGDDRESLLGQCLELNRKRNNQIGTGFLSTPFVLHALTEAGCISDAYKIMTNPATGWMKQVNEGATTVWENWTNDASLNHYSKGACCQWLFEDVCGIHLNGVRNHFFIEPQIVPEMEYARFEYNSRFGRVSCKWQKSNKGYDYTVEIPANCTAEVAINGLATMTLDAGTYRVSGDGSI